MDENVISEASTLRKLIADISSGIYASESMIYLTCGIDDLYENADIDVESAVVKIYCQEKLLELVMAYYGNFDANATTKSNPFEKLLRDTLQMQAYGDPKETLKLYVGISGIQYAGVCSFCNAIRTFLKSYSFSTCRKNVSTMLKKDEIHCIIQNML